MAATVQIYCLSTFTEAEQGRIVSRISGDSEQCEGIQLIPWDRNYDGNGEDIYRIFTRYRRSQDDFMFFVDRESILTKSLIIVDGRASESDWAVEQTLTQYGFSYRDDWCQDSTIRNIIASSTVIYGRSCVKRYGGIRSIATAFDQHDVCFERVVVNNTISYAYSNDTDGVHRALSQRIEEFQQGSIGTSQSSSTQTASRDLGISDSTYRNSSSTTSQQTRSRDLGFMGSTFDTDSSYQAAYAGAGFDDSFSDQTYSVSDSSYIDNSYRPYQGEICDAMYADQRNGFVSQDNTSYAYSNNLSCGYGGDGYYSDGYSSDRVKERTSIDSGYFGNDGYEYDNTYKSSSFNQGYGGDYDTSHRRTTYNNQVTYGY